MAAMMLLAMVPAASATANAVTANSSEVLHNHGAEGITAKSPDAQHNHRQTIEDHSHPEKPTQGFNTARLAAPPTDISVQPLSIESYCSECDNETEWVRCTKESCDEHFYCPQGFGGKCVNPDECDDDCTLYSFVHDYCSECGNYENCWYGDDPFCGKCGEEIPDYNCYVCRKLTEWVRCPKDICDEHFYCPAWWFAGKCAADPDECEGDCTPYSFPHDYCSECTAYDYCDDGGDSLCRRCGEEIQDFNCRVCRKVTEWVSCSKEPCDEHFYCPREFGGKCANPDGCDGDCTPYNFAHDYCSECGDYEECWDYDDEPNCDKCGGEIADYNCWVCRKVVEWIRCPKEICDEHFYCPELLGGECANPDGCEWDCTPYTFAHDYCSECGDYDECWDEYGGSCCSRCGEEIPEYNCWVCRKVTEWEKCSKETCDEHFYCPVYRGGKCANPRNCDDDCTPFDSAHDYCIECGAYGNCTDEDDDGICEWCGEEVPEYSCWVCRKLGEWVRCPKEICDEHFYCPEWWFGEECANPYECDDDCTPVDFDHHYCSECGYYGECWEEDKSSDCYMCGEKISDYNCSRCRKITEWLFCNENPCYEHAYCPNDWYGKKCANPGDCYGDCTPLKVPHDYCSRCGSFGLCSDDDGDGACELCGHNPGDINCSCIVCESAKSGTIKITANPKNVTVTEGKITGSISVTATASNGSKLSYQWYREQSGSLGDELISGATGSTFTIPTNLAPGSYSYYCMISAVGCKDVSTSGVKVTVVKAGDAGQSSTPHQEQNNTIVMRLNSTKALLNGKDIAVDPSSKDVSPFTLNSKTMVPVRFLQQLGAEVDYVSDDKPVIVSNGEIKLELVFGSDIMKKTVGTAAPVDVKLPTAPTMIEGKTCVPIREVAENLGFSVKYDSQSFVIVASVEPLSDTQMAAKINEGKALEAKIEAVRSIKVAPATQSISTGNSNSVTIDRSMVTFTTDSGNPPGCNLLVYASSDNAVAMVTSRGRVIGQKAGTAVITVKSHNGQEARVTLIVK